VALAVELDPGAQTYADGVEQVAEAGVEAVVLAASPRAGALFLNEYDASGMEKPRWFLSPLLKTELFVQNVTPGAVEGALGVAPRIFELGADFADAFSARWQGDQPLEGAYFYYDATVLVAFALASATQDGSASNASSTSAAIRDVARPFGEQVGWQNVANGLRQIGAGERVYYSGLTGPLLFDECGSREFGVSTVWTIRSGVIENEER
jgi:ABC-type branched-subunit amino acid transport system substrate-binding protein